VFAFSYLLFTQTLLIIDHGGGMSGMIDSSIGGVSLESVLNTPEGLVPLDWLKPGDLVETWDAGFQPIARVSPVTGRGGSVLGGQRLLTAGWPIEMYFGCDEMLVMASDILDEDYNPDACFAQIMMDVTAMVRVDDLWIESHGNHAPLHPVLNANDIALVKRAFGCPLMRCGNPGAQAPFDVSTTFGSRATAA
jgi:hypothetical protein